MTFRPPTTKQTRRRSRQTDSRRNVIFTITFGVASAAALALLFGVLGANYYSDHGAPIASVNGTAISKDAVRARADAMTAVANRKLADYDLLRNQNKISTSDLSQLTSTISSDPSTVLSNALDSLTEAAMLKDYASKNGISVSDAEVDAQIAKDGTLPEFRHVKVIAVEPAISAPGAVASSSDVAAGQATLQGYLDQIKSGQKWDDVFKQSQTDNAVVSASGDLGMNTRDSLNLDPDLVEAVFNLKNVNDITPIMKGEDGVLRFATVTTILPAYPDTGWKDNVNGDEYRRLATEEALKSKIQAQIETKYVTGASDARHVQDIFIGVNPYSQTGVGSEVRARLIIFAPNHDTTKVTTLAATDPAWTDAKNRAQAAYDAIKKDPTQFNKIALDTKQNDDKFLASIAGQLPWLQEALYAGDASQQQGLGMTAVPAALFKTGAPLGLMAPILEPTMGWVVVDNEGMRPAPDQRVGELELALNTGMDFSTAAQKYSEAQDANSGADMGWVFKYQLSNELHDAIWAAPVGGLTRVVADTDGWHIYKVLADETRTPDANQQLSLKKAVFTSWLADLKSGTNIWTDTAGLTAMSPQATP